MFLKNKKTGQAFIPNQRKTISGLKIGEPSKYDQAVSKLGLNAMEKNHREKNIETQRILLQHAGLNPTINAMQVVDNIKSDQEHLIDLQIEEQRLLKQIQSQQQIPQV